MDNPRVTRCSLRSAVSPIVGPQNLKCACVDCSILNRMSALLPREGENSLRRAFEEIDLRADQILFRFLSRWKQKQLGTTLLHTALTYHKELTSYDPDYCLGILQSVYPRYVGSIHCDCRSIPFLCVCAALCRELQTICATDAAIDKFVSGQIAVGRLQSAPIADRDDRGGPRPPLPVRQTWHARPASCVEIADRDRWRFTPTVPMQRPDRDNRKQAATPENIRRRISCVLKRRVRSIHGRQFCFCVRFNDLNLAGHPLCRAACCLLYSGRRSARRHPQTAAAAAFDVFQNLIGLEAIHRQSTTIITRPTAFTLAEAIRQQLANAIVRTEVVVTEPAESELFRT